MFPARPSDTSSRFNGVKRAPIPALLCFPSTGVVNSAMMAISYLQSTSFRLSLTIAYCVVTDWGILRSQSLFGYLSKPSYFKFIFIPKVYVFEVTERSTSFHWCQLLKVPHCDNTHFGTCTVVPRLLDLPRSPM